MRLVAGRASTTSESGARPEACASRWRRVEPAGPAACSSNTVPSSSATSVASAVTSFVTDAQRLGTVDPSVMASVYLRAGWRRRRPDLLQHQPVLVGEVAETAVRCHDHVLRAVGQAVLEVDPQRLHLLEEVSGSVGILNVSLRVSRRQAAFDPR